MKCRQSLPRQWFVADGCPDEQLLAVVRRLPRASGILFLYRDSPKRRRASLLAKLRRIARARQLVLVDEATGEAARVHSSKEILRAGIAGTPILFLSPMFETRSHPDWNAMPRLRAAALLRLAKAPIIALGGMDGRRFRRIQRLGFSGWAGIGVWIRT